MALLRALGRGRKNKLDVLKLIEYAAGIGTDAKHIWEEHVIPWTDLVAAYGLPVDPIEAAGEIVGLHEAFNTAPSENLVYHVLIDFKSDCGLNPWDVARIVWDINGFLRNLGIAYYQGVHCSTLREKEHPHAHIVINALSPVTGCRVQVNHSFLIFFKNYANDVLRTAGQSLIAIGRRSLPFRIVLSQEKQHEQQ